MVSIDTRAYEHRLGSGRSRAASLLVVALLASLLIHGQPAEQTPAASRLVPDLMKLPLSFEANHGQADQDVRYMARGDGFTLYLTDSGPKITLAGDPGAHIAMNVAGADRRARITGGGRLPGVVNYLKGDDRSKWQTGVPTFRAARYEEILPGTDLVFYGTKQHLEFDFVLAPGADPDDIVLTFDGVERLSLTDSGALRVATAPGPIVFDAPNAYQDVHGERAPVDASWSLRAGRARFDIGEYDTSRSLVIDPLASLAYSTFLGGASLDRGFGIAVDGSGNAFVTGDSAAAATDLPTTPGAFDTTQNGDFDAFVAKLDAAGSNLLYSTFLGGSGSDSGSAIAVDGSGDAYVTGNTGDAADFPVTAGAFDTSHNGSSDAFVAKLDATGSNLVYSTFLGGADGDDGFGIDVDAAGIAYVTGDTASSDFPSTLGAVDITHNGGVFDAFVAKLNADGSGLVYSTFLGGNDFDVGFGIAADTSGNAYVTGDTRDGTTDFPTPVPGAFDTTHNGVVDAFVAKLDAAGSNLLYSTFLGGSESDTGSGIAVDGSGSAYVTGNTGEATTVFPVTAGAFDTGHTGGLDAFVTKLDAAGSDLVYSTFLGGGDDDLGFGIAVDGSGNAYVTGDTADAPAGTIDFPATPGAFDTTHNGDHDAFVAELDAAGSDLLYSTFLGGNDDDQGFAIAVDGVGNAYVTGHTFDFGAAPDLRTTFGAFDTTHNGVGDAFVAKFAARTLRIGDVAKREGRRGRKIFSFPVTLSHPAQETVTVNAATADGTATAGSDYVAASGVLVFAPGQTQVTASVQVIGDRRRERKEKFFVNLSDVEGPATIADGQGQGTIRNDD